MALMEGPKKVRWRWRKWMLLATGFLLLVIVLANLWVVLTVGSCVYPGANAVPPHSCILVLGTDLIRFDGTTNFHFSARTSAAVALFEAGKADSFILSGNSHNHGFNEPREMAAELIRRGVPAEIISLDEGGRRTIRSAQNARDVFHLKRVVLVTDHFHAARSVFLFRHYGIEAMASCCQKEPALLWPIWYEVREILARVKAAWEIGSEKLGG